MINFTEFYEQLNNPNLDVSLLEKGFNFGKSKHSGQIRKISGVPYFTHPISVALHLKEYDEDIIIAGLLHDVIEDTETKEEEILELFGPIVLNLVKGMTKNPETKDIFGPLSEAANEDNRVILVKLADRLDNLSDGILQMPEKTQKKYLNETPDILKFSLKYNITKFHREINDNLISIRNHQNR